MDLPKMKINLARITPVQSGWILASLFFLIGLAIKYWLCIPFAVTGWLIGAIGKLLVDKAGQKGMFEPAIETENEFMRTIVLFDEYLGTMPVENVEIENRLKQNWQAANEQVSKLGYGPGHDISYDVKDGNRDFVKTNVLQEIRIFHQKKGDPHCQGWGSFMAMLKNRSNSCYYRWGVNKLGLEIHRFGKDRYTLIKAWNDNYYKP